MDARNALLVSQIFYGIDRNKFLRYYWIKVIESQRTYPYLSLIMLPLLLPVLQKELVFVGIILHFLAPINSYAHVHLIALNNTECCGNILFAIFKSGKAKFDDLTKLFLNYPYKILDNQLLTKDPTSVPKIAILLGKSIPPTKYQITYKVAAMKYLS